MAMQVVRLLVGAALLLLGRQLYWVFVAGVGFVVAMDLASRLAQVESTLLILLIALSAGVIGALLAVFLQRAAIGIAGLLAGGYVVLLLLEYIGMQTSPLSWVLAFVGGAVGVVLILMLFEWALILLSSLTGAWMITQALNLTRTVTGLAFLVLLVIGVAIQASLMRQRNGQRTRP